MTLFLRDKSSTSFRADSTKVIADDKWHFIAGVVAIGRHYDRYTKGIIDDVALFNVALTEKDLKEIMNKGLQTALSVSNNQKLALTWSTIKQH